MNPLHRVVPCVKGLFSKVKASLFVTFCNSCEWVSAEDKL